MNDSCLLCGNGWEQGQHIVAIGYVGNDGTAGIRLVHRACLVKEVSGVVTPEARDEINEYIARERANDDA